MAWNYLLIVDYLSDCVDGACVSVTALKVEIQLHLDIVSSLQFCVWNGRTLLLSSSLDCSVQLYDVTTKSLVGVFGQVGISALFPSCFF